MASSFANHIAIAGNKLTRMMTRPDPMKRSTPARHVIHGNLRGSMKSNRVIGTGVRNDGMRQRGLCDKADPAGVYQPAVSPETADAETLSSALGSSSLSSNDVVTFNDIKPPKRITGPSPADVSKKTKFVVDEIMQFIMPVMGIDANDPDVEHRQILESLETQIFIMDKVVEDCQSNGIPWDIDDMVLHYKATMVAAGAWRSPIVQAMTHHITTYFQLETDVLKSDRPVDLETIRRVWLYRSNDLRLLMLATSAAVGQLDDFESDDSMHEVLDEIFSMVELACDLEDYEEDVTDDSFNTIRLFARLFGQEKALEYLRLEVEEGLAQFKEAVANLPPAQQKAAWAVMDRWHGAMDLHSVTVQEEAGELYGSEEYCPLTPAHPCGTRRGRWMERMHSGRITTV